MELYLWWGEYPHTFSGVLHGYRKESPPSMCYSFSYWLIVTDWIFVFINIINVRMYTCSPCI